MSYRERLAGAARRHGVADGAARLEQFVALFERWNGKINLSAARTAEDIAGHVVDSLALAPHLPAAGAVVDVGTGGGFPALIIAIARPALRIRCVEPIHKKTAFLSTAARELGLDGVEIVTRRVTSELDHGFDVAMSRATFDLAAWLALGSTLVKPGGLVVGMEGRDQVELGPGDTRHPYSHEDRQRAIILRRVPLDT
ncbi:MAG: 16S rRNA (guanine(527)-N(7))-methyltransferase RsmG [Kofleriaceae bacterium]